MAKKDPRIDAYIEKSADFAKPVLKHFRSLVHKTCPDVEEKIKWGFPHFDYHGGPMAHMASFKNHCAVGFWKASLMKNADALVEKAKNEEAMGHLGRITSLKNLPDDRTLAGYIKQGMRLNEEGIKLSSNKAKPGAKKELEVPDYFLKALKKNKTAKKTFDDFTYSHKKEYVEWISEAKTEPTRDKRVETSVEWLSEGKSRHWKYKK
jgi:uncharacterized protein YdeI (YjbR/CyaY-like superfamily)